MTAPRESTFVLGHQAAEQEVLDAWNSGRMTHSWLMCGPRGIGKASFAFRLARFVLSGLGEAQDDGPGLFGPAEPVKPTNLDVPTDHPAFRRIAAAGHADFKVIERGYTESKGEKVRRRSEIVIDDVRGIGQFLSLTPAEGGWRVVLIDAADEMNRNAANAVLKVLEEPPKRSLMILLAHNPGRLLPTIRSRCRKLVLQPLAETQVAELICRNRPDLAESDVLALARLAEGSAGRALDLADSGGLDLYRDVIALLSGLPRLNVPALHALGDKLAKAGAEDSWRSMGELLGWWLARLVRAGGRGEAGPEIVAGEAEIMARLLAAGGLDQWVEVWEKITHLFARADSVNLDRKQVVLNAFLSVERLVRA